MSTKPPVPEPAPKPGRKPTRWDIAFPWVLSPRLWSITLLLWIALAWGIPALYRAKTRPPDIGKRAPFAASEDYWGFRARARKTSEEDRIAVLGDSVVWGQYVTDRDTLPSALNQMEGGERFVNLGVNGLHPAALRGLVTYHGRALSKGRVIVFGNLLWMSSPRHDLTIEEVVSFNHPDLIPQFRPWLACYDAPLDRRISRVLSRHIVPMIWAKHLRIRYFENQNVFRWMLDHPRALPSFEPRDEPDLAPGVRPGPWREGGLRASPMDFVEPNRSFQWASFLDTLDLLEKRGNRVMVVLLPFNEHMLTEPGLTRYANVKQQVIEALRKRALPVVAASLLPSGDYADSSHPLPAGYEAIARELLNHPVFVRFVSEPSEAQAAGEASPPATDEPSPGTIGEELR